MGNNDSTPKLNEIQEGYIYVKTDKPYYHPGDEV